MTECRPDLYVQQAPQRMEMSSGASVTIRELDTTLDADSICRSMGATGASGGCGAHLGRGARPGIAALLIGFAVAVRRARRRSRMS